jgi:hypothetical protein
MNPAAGGEPNAYLADVELKPLLAKAQKRLELDDATQTVFLDGKPIPVNDPKAYAIFAVLVKAYIPGKPVSNALIQNQVNGVRGHNVVSHYLKKLPPELSAIIETNTNGKSLRLPS